MSRSVLLAIATALGPAAAAESPQRFALELRIGGYHPRIDSEPGLVASEPRPVDAPMDPYYPYARIFGNSGFALFELEFDWQVTRLFGTLGAGMAAGYFAAVGKGLFAATEGADAGKASDDSTALLLVPIRALGVWRVDEFARRWNVPLVPYAKLGFGPTLFWVTNGHGGVSWYDGNRAAGTRWGWEAAAGLMFLLDFIDPILSAEFDYEWGVNGSYVFLEFRANRVGTMGRPGFNFSDDLFTGGLALEF